MTRGGILLALGGLALALLLLAQQDLSAVWRLLGTAGFGLVLAALAHIPSMALNAHAWALLLPGRTRPALPGMTAIVWIRESVNGLLPVARIGGEVASYRLLRRRGVRVPAASASLLVDVTIGILSQLAFALIGLGLLALEGGTVGWVGLGLSIGLGLALGGGLVAVQRAGLFGRVVGALNKVAAGRLSALTEHSRRIDRATLLLWGRRRAILGCFLWQLAGWMAGALEIWLALYFLGAPVGVVEALVIESLIQMVSSAAFLLPGALGAQEGGFLAIGALLGLDPAVAAALAVSRRLRDLVIFLPGLLAWVLAERRPGGGAAGEPGKGPGLREA
ncbi:lysylphosphatidylglycerol synthase domain-containing protein [Roseomonas sp. NAR14]|uniref:Lysylphosphatidylglycerol synthase domain-containing protein n=1 Tax=Roseomonas acroporae TaxID=2937791 RepID=A0A9X2BTQ0_9PROT|nr:lysylphosphatidylglycerol synthase domain-containing protein [Roseomonas acroporae]MCK8784843.1 lysylphosphatidylglycerol synthase domain-containing protein [Roseomonas acroporae]